MSALLTWLPAIALIIVTAALITREEIRRYRWRRHLATLPVSAPWHAGVTCELCQVTDVSRNLTLDNRGRVVHASRRDCVSPFAYRSTR